MSLDFGTLRSLFNQPATAATWALICEELGRVEPARYEAFDDSVRPYCEAQLRQWPQDLERRLPDAMIRSLWSEQPHPALTLTDRLGMYRIIGPQLELARRSVERLGPLGLLRSLTMIYCELDHEQLEGWVKALEGSGLKSLVLHNNPLTELSALIESPLALQLRELDLFDSVLEDHHAAALVLAESMSGLEVLELLGAGVGPLTAAALGAPSALPRLRSLNLGGSELEDEQVEALLGAQRPALSALNLNENQLTDLSLERLARHDSLIGLRSLNLWFNQIGDAGVSALFGSSRMSELEELHIGSNDEVSPEVFAQELAQVRRSRLKLLSMDGLALEGEHMAQIAESEALACVEHLHLNHNPIGDVGAQALASSPHLSKLRTLALQSCQIGPEGVEALMRAPWAAQLERLELSMNPIEDRGAQAIAQGPCSRLETLLLGMCEMTSAGDEALIQSATLSEALRHQLARE